jgi:hypothetical protein
MIPPSRCFCLNVDSYLNIVRKTEGSGGISRNNEVCNVLFFQIMVIWSRRLFLKVRRRSECSQEHGTQACDLSIPAVTLLTQISILLTTEHGTQACDLSVPAVTLLAQVSILLTTERGTQIRALNKTQWSHVLNWLTVNSFNRSHIVNTGL